MFLLWAIPIGVVVGFLLRGNLGRLGELRFRWAPLAIAGLVVQVALFTETGDRLAGALGPAIYVLSTAAVFVAVVRNLAMPGMVVVALGAALNLAAITANGGMMPADEGALRYAGFEGPGAHTNSVVLPDPALHPLTDVYALPAWMPLANVFSIGDVLIALGVALAIVAAMRGWTPGRGGAPSGGTGNGATNDAVARGQEEAPGPGRDRPSR